MKTIPKISIIVPVYNTAIYLTRCLNSLVNQTLEEIEIIIVNDGSTDNSQQIIDNYVTNYPHKIKAFIKQNGGLGDARNQGILISAGQYIGFVDSDDFVDNKMFQNLYKKAVENSYDIVFCNHIDIYSDNYEIQQDMTTKFQISKYNIDAIVCSKIFLKKFLSYNKLLFTTRVKHEDYDFYFRAASLTDKISHIRDYLYFYEKNNLNSITAQQTIHFDDFYFVCKNLSNWNRRTLEHRCHDFSYYTQKLFLYIILHDNNTSRAMVNIQNTKLFDFHVSTKLTLIYKFLKFGKYPSIYTIKKLYSIIYGYVNK